MSHASESAYICCRKEDQKKGKGGRCKITNKATERKNNIILKGSEERLWDKVHKGTPIKIPALQTRPYKC